MRPITERFKLDDKFILDYATKDVDWGPLGYVTYKRTYARPLSSISGRHAALAGLAGLRGLTEEWWLTVARVVEGCYTFQKQHCADLGLPWNWKKASASAKEMYGLMFSMKFLPPGRGLWMMGTPFVEERGSAALNNCGFVSTENVKEDFAEPFCWLMDMSMYGVGVGFDCKGAAKVCIHIPENSVDTFVVEDTREGWVALVRRVLNAFVGVGTLPTRVDYSDIRPAGTEIKSFGGTASGPAPLKLLYARLVALLWSNQGTLTEAVITEICCMIGDCVVAGNVRRSALIGFGSTAKFKALKQDPQWFKQKPWLGRANLSVNGDLINDYSEMAHNSGTTGEPGYIWLSNIRNYSRMDDPADGRDSRAAGCNPCVEQSLEPYELCCLVETFPSRHDCMYDYHRTLKFAYLYAKTVTLVPTHNKRTNAVVMRNRRIGTSQSGIVQAIERQGFEHYIAGFCDAGYSEIRNWDETYSEWLCIPMSIKVTSVKPSGSVSLLPGVTAGMHYPCSEYYIKLMRLTPTSALIPILVAAGYETVDLPNENAVGVKFPVHFPSIRSRGEVGMWEQMELAAQLQGKWADNQVSCTVTVKPHEVEELAGALAMYSSRLKGISFLPYAGDWFENAPETPIDKKDYDEYVARLKPYDLSTVGHEVTAKYCDSESCEI